VRCRFEISDTPWPVKIDPGQIGQVINNIILNADQAMPGGGTISIATENVVIGRQQGLPLKEGRHVKIAINDHGLGIPKNHLAKIFDPYFTTKQKGSGIGLAIAHSIVEKHNGFITVESQVGIGTTVCVYLPSTSQPLSKKSEDHSTLIRGSGKVLLMDDEDDIRTVSSEMLKALGYTVVCAHDGTEAVALYTQAYESGEVFEAAILDLTIPGGMGGKEASHKILELDSSAAIIVSSGYSNDPIMSEFKNHGFQAAMSKPYRIQELSTTLKKVIEARRRK
jgi:CheY-like chemotaxis protein/anti-sigma regulatory factor (Ser/Thr protein kinase)